MTKVKMELESPNLDENQDLDNFLEKLNIKKKLYQEALTVSESGKTANLKRTLKDRNVNNYNLMYIKAWNGNMNLQFCHNAYAGKIFFREFVYEANIARSQKRLHGQEANWSV